MGWFTVGRRARATALAASLILLVVSSAAPLAAQATALTTTHQLKVTERDQAGRPLMGAAVLLSAMPPDASTGTVVPMGRRAVTDDSGEATWNIHLSPDELKFAGRNGGWLNYTAVGLDRSDHPIAVTGFSLYLGNDAARDLVVAILLTLFLIHVAILTSTVASPAWRASFGRHRRAYALYTVASAIIVVAVSLAQMLGSSPS